MLPGSNWPPWTAQLPASSLRPRRPSRWAGRPAVANACGVLPRLAESARSGAGTWPQRRQGGRGGGRRGPCVGRRDAGAKPSVAADFGQAQALIAPGPAAYVAASCPPRHTARSPDHAVRCPAVRARSCGDRGLVGVGRRHPATHLRLAVGPGPAVAAVMSPLIIRPGPPRRTGGRHRCQPLRCSGCRQRQYGWRAGPGCCGLGHHRDGSSRYRRWMGPSELGGKCTVEERG
jgi:hypothetical protein